MVDDALYVRAYNGQNSRWYQAALRQTAGRIKAAGMTREVAFEPVDGSINDRIDEVYRAKYKGSPYLTPMIGTPARSATVRIVPQDRSMRNEGNKMPHVLLKFAAYRPNFSIMASIRREGHRGSKSNYANDENFSSVSSSARRSSVSGLGGLSVQGRHP